MFKKFLLIKKFNKLLLSVNRRIESFFDSLKVLINSKKKIKLYLTNIDRRFLIFIGSIISLFFTYFFLPAFYDKNLVKIKLENQILERYNLEAKFQGRLTYGLFPKPHFFIKDTIISHLDENLAISDIAKIYIAVDNFFSLENLKIKNIFFKQTEFDIIKKN